MKSLKIVTYVMLGAIATLFSFSAVAKESTKQFAEDTLITTKVVSKLTADSSITSKDIITNTHNGHVQLCGFAKDSNEAKAAVKVAKNVDGVKSVYDDLMPMTDLKSSKSDSNDTTITAKVKEQLMTDKEIPMNQINVVTEQGQVQLCGFVANNKIKQKAHQLASTVKDVQGVKNSLRLKA